MPRCPIDDGPLRHERLKARMSRSLSTKGPSFDRLAVGVEDLEVVDAGSRGIAVGPDDGLVGFHLGELDVVALGVLARDHGVSVREPLNAAGVVDRLAGEVFVGEAPDRLARVRRPR